MKSLFKSRQKKIILFVTSIFFVLSNLYFLAFHNAPTAQAQGVQVVINPTQMALDIKTSAFNILQLSKDEILNDLKATFFKNVVANLARSFAKASAKWIVSGGKGNQPFWETDIYGSIIDKGQAAAEDWIVGAVSQGTGLDLCNFDPTLTLNIALTLPNKPDKIKKEKTIFGGTAQGCSFKDLQDKFSPGSSGLNDFLKIKVTDIGPNFQQTTDQLIRDIDQNQTLKTYDAGVTGNNPQVLTDLNTQATNLQAMSKQLDDDITKMLDARGTNELAHLSVGDKLIAPEYINDIKDAWNQKISAAKNQANALKAAYGGCRNKNLAAMLGDPTCAALITSGLGYSSLPTLSLRDNHFSLISIFIHEALAATAIPANSKEAGILERELQAKFNNAYNMYNSVSTGLESLSQFLNYQVKPDMFATSGVYTWQSAKTFSNPQADPANTTANQVSAGTGAAQAKASDKQKVELATTGGWKNVVDTISGKIKTPADLLKAKSIKDLIPQDTTLTYTKSIVADSLGVFLQELYNLYIQSLLKSLSNPKDQKSKKNVNIFSGEEQGMVTSEGVNLYYDNLDQGKNCTLPDLNLLQDFQTNVANSKLNPNIYNNVIDLNFALAINQHLTIGEAIKAQDLKGDSHFSWGETLQPNTYNLANIAKLRKARVVPLGLELAAELIRDCNYRLILDDKGPDGKPDGSPDYNTFQDITASQFGYQGPDAYNKQRLQNCLFAKPGDVIAGHTLTVGEAQGKNIELMLMVKNATLNDVVGPTDPPYDKGFNARGADNICGTYDAGESPFCNLVDPEWILKIPATKCLQEQKTEAYGEILQDNSSGTRYSRCADFISLLEDASSTNCTSSQYGVCVKEKNVWRLGGQTCSSWNDSCSAYTVTNSQGKDSTVAYLKNTLDPDGCSADSVGCKKYIRSYDSSNFYFNSNVQSCEAKDEGCHEFISDPSTIDSYPTLPDSYTSDVLGTRVYYKTNPGCEANPSGPGCSNFMARCSDSEVGCAAFTPTNGDPVVNAVIKPEDQCPAECNGFSAFFRQPTNFEPVSKLDYFVANTAQTCQAASVGCSEFTNLEKASTVANVAEAVEYYTSIRQCIKAGSDAKTFFTWQSIATGPQQIISHILQADATDGSPVTYDDSKDCSLDLESGNYCLKFYDTSGKTYYRDIRKTIIVSDTACHPLRKTVSNQATCIATNGTWDTTNNYCIYNAYLPNATEAAKAGFGEASKTCAKAENGCFNYLGYSGHNVYYVFEDDFETIVPPETSPVVPDSYGTTPADLTGLSIGTDFLDPIGYFLQIDASSQAQRSVDITGGYTYTIEFLARGTVAGKLAISNFGSVNVTNTWGFYTLGPVKLGVDLSSLIIDNQTGAAVNIDNIILEQYKANYYLIADSWSNPACTFDDLNCQQYSGPNQQTFYLKSFSNLCTADKVGCQYLVDTQNSLNPQAQNFSGVIIPADQKPAYVVNDNFKCVAANKGCEKFIEPVLSQGSGVVFDTVYLKNDPDVYEGAPPIRPILCKSDAEGCTKLVNSNGSPEYYKIDPTKICLYQSPIAGLGGLSQSGWVVAGSTLTVGCNTIKEGIDPNSCDANGGLWLADLGQCAIVLPETTLESCAAANGIWTTSTTDPTVQKCVDNPFALYKTKDTPKYRGYTAECPTNEDGCSGFQTINQDNTSGDTYYLLDNGLNLDRSTCTSVDWAKGCVAFKNSATNQVDTLKVTRDRDCAEWVDCLQFDNQGNCIRVAALYKDNQGDIQTSKESVSSDYCQGRSQSDCGQFCSWNNSTSECTTITNRLLVKDLKDQVRYSTAGEPQIITRKTYIQRFANTSDRWNVGDYSGYTIPDRYPLETELAKGFTTYPQEKAASNDTRFTEPVCKIFPAEDAPVPYEITRKMGYAKIQNVYSQSVATKDVADACNYDQVDASAVTTYFPFGYLNKVNPEDNPKICTGKVGVNGKLCEGPVDKNPACTSPVDNQSGNCTAVENLKHNFGIQGRCLEMDILNPLYGNITPGSYACLSYFPFNYNECGVITNQPTCENLPACSWVDNKCVSDICQFYKSQSECEGDMTTGTPPEKRCLWDGAKGVCLFKKCSFSNASSPGTCQGLAPYCKWWGNRCIEDICSEPYAGLLSSTGTLNSTLMPQLTLCMNPSEAPNLSSIGGPGKGNYCAWQMTGPSDKGRYKFYCNLQCDLKYPDASYKSDCNNDPFCKFQDTSCRGQCSLLTADECALNPSCGLLSDNSTCVNKCQAANSTGDFTGCTTANGCAPRSCVEDNANNPCSGKTDLSTPPCSSILDASGNTMCTWTGSACIKDDDHTCANITPIANCAATTGCKLEEKCYNPTLESESGVSTNFCTGVTNSTDCQNVDHRGYCSWGGKCVTRLDTKGCASYEYTEGAPGNNTGQKCSAADCNWARYTYGNTKYYFCFPKGYGTEYTCHICKTDDGQTWNSWSTGLGCFGWKCAGE